MLRLIVLAAVLTSATSRVSASDLASIDRTIAKEPAYQSKQVKYCLLVFGPEAKTRVWLVQDGDTLYVDRNGNGDLTGEAKCVPIKQKDKFFRTFEAGSITDGLLTHTDLSISQLPVDEGGVGNAKEFARIKAQGGEPWTWWIRLSVERPADDSRPLPKRISYVINGDGFGYLLFANRPQEAPVIHLNGPWTLGLQDVKQQLTAGRSSRLQLGVGTPGIGPGTFAYVEYPKTIPVDVYPQAEITFPNQIRGADPITERYTLKSRC